MNTEQSTGSTSFQEELTQGLRSLGAQDIVTKEALTGGWRRQKWNLNKVYEVSSRQLDNLVNKELFDILERHRSPQSGTWDPFPEYYAIAEIVEEAILAIPEASDHIFRTVNDVGARPSTYVIVGDGVIRLKYFNRGGFGPVPGVQKPSGYCGFIDEDTFELIHSYTQAGSPHTTFSNIRENNGIIPVVSLSVGARPLEFQDRSDVTVLENGLRISPELRRGFHPGHPIFQIIK